MAFQQTEDNYFEPLDKDVFDALLFDFIQSRIWKWMKFKIEQDIAELQESSLLAVLSEKDINGHNERVYRKKALESIIELVNEARQYGELEDKEN